MNHGPKPMSEWRAKLAAEEDVSSAEPRGKPIPLKQTPKDKVIGSRGVGHSINASCATQRNTECFSLSYNMLMSSTSEAMRWLLNT
jgi:hypothetical protein